MEIEPTAQPEVKKIMLSPTRMYHVRKDYPHKGDNKMYWGIMYHDTAGFRFRCAGMTLEKMSAHLAKVAPAKIM